MSRDKSIISWQNVGQLIADVEREHNGHVEITITKLAGEYKSGDFVICVSITPMSVAKPKRPKVKVHGNFPSRRWKTVTGALVNLLLELSAKEQASQAEAEQLAREGFTAW